MQSLVPKRVVNILEKTYNFDFDGHDDLS